MKNHFFSTTFLVYRLYVSIYVNILFFRYNILLFIRTSALCVYVIQQCTIIVENTYLLKHCKFLKYCHSSLRRLEKKTCKYRKIFVFSRFFTLQYNAHALCHSGLTKKIYDFITFETLLLHCHNILLRVILTNPIFLQFPRTIYERVCVYIFFK